MKARLSAALRADEQGIAHRAGHPWSSGLPTIFRRSGAESRWIRALTGGARQRNSVGPQVLTSSVIERHFPVGYEPIGAARRDRAPKGKTSTKGGRHTSAERSDGRAPASATQPSRPPYNS